MQHPQPKEIERGATVHLSLSILQTGDLPLTLPIPFQPRYASVYRCIITPHS
jgi:hypothetical protein